MEYIKVWCDYSIGGWFGGNNDEEVFIINDTICDNEEIYARVLAELVRRTNLSEEELDGLWDWSFIEPDYL